MNYGVREVVKKATQPGSGSDFRPAEILRNEKWPRVFGAESRIVRDK
jgi:hypothetical protein